MPLYEYRCQLCGREFQYLVLKKEDEENLRCPGCKESNLKKLVSRVAYHVSEQDRLSAYDPNSPKDDAFYKDTRNIGLHAKKRAQQMGFDLGSGFETKLDRLRTDPGKVFDDTD
ncbi:MAG: zinc ribbon domain-containing protein [Desulfobacteraceae bacterium]|nr:MAG: zinc ribbon domain-containing protein [Desulfobacteraceae bacterium]